MSKLISELLPTDDVVVVFEAKKAYDEEKGEMVVTDTEKQQVMTYAGYESIELNDSNVSPTLGRKVTLAGTPVYQTKDSNLGKIQVLAGIAEFDTVEGRAAAKGKKTKGEDA